MAPSHIAVEESAACATAIDTEETWVQGPLFSESIPLHAGLRSMEQNLRCPICKDFCRTAVSVQPCQHTFCSECIRRTFQLQLAGMKREAVCPCCRTSVDVSGGSEFQKCLKPNRSISIMIDIFTGIRNDLRTALSHTNTTTAATHASDSDANPPAAASSSDLAARSSGGDQSSALPLPMKKKCRPAFTCLKKKQLQELCRKEGLSASGTDKDLIARYDAFLTLYNAETDALHPRSQAQLVQEVEQRERARHDQHRRDHKWNGEAAAQSNYVEQAFRLRNATSEQEAAAVKSTLEESEVAQKFKDRFAKLIDQGKAQRKAKQPSKQQAPDSATNLPTATEEHDSITNQQNSACSVAATTLGGDSIVTQSSSTPSMSGMKRPSPDSPEILVSSTQSPVQKGCDGRGSNDFENKTPNCMERQVTISPQKQDQAPAASSQQKQSGPVEADVIVLSSNESNNKRQRTTSSSSRSVRSKRSTSPSIIGDWDCAVCTFRNTINRSSRARCEMCDNLRPLPGQVSQQQQVVIPLHNNDDSIQIID